MQLPEVDHSRLAINLRFGARSGLVDCRRAVSGAEARTRGGSASAAVNPYHRTGLLAWWISSPPSYQLLCILLASAQGTDAAAREPFRSTRCHSQVRGRILTYRRPQKYIAYFCKGQCAAEIR
jgi:hypothetical protein